MTTEQRIATEQIRNTPELVSLCEQLIAGFENVYLAAGRELQWRPSCPDPLAPTGVGKALQEMRQVYTALRREPFLTRVEVQWGDTGLPEVLYVCRRESGGLKVPELDGRLISYRTELGKLAELDTGEEVTLRLPGKSREAFINARVKVKPRFVADEWDGLDNLFDMPDCCIGVESLRGLLAFLKRKLDQDRAIFEEVDVLGELLKDDEQATLFYDERRRKTVLRMELRDQPILDRYQGEIFRLPLSQQLLLLGPPGTGKTTTLIKRLAQKRTDEALTPEEKEVLDRHRLTEEFRRDDSWVMFSPTDLLKLYVREAFAREGVPCYESELKNLERRKTSSWAKCVEVP